MQERNKNGDKTLEEGKPSQTAFMVAVHRAHHYLTAPEPKILRDSLALPLSGAGSEAAIQAYMDAIEARFTELSDAETSQIFVRRIVDSVCMRSRVVEECLAASLSRGMQQVVVLGAGLDSTAYRCTDLIKGLDVFEVDHPATQAWKRQRLADANIEIPENVRFVSYDFENQTLAEALRAGGVEADKMTFFTWLGVHMYLTDAAVKSTFAVMGDYPKGSEMVMDFISPDYVDTGGLVENSVDYLAKVVTEMGEPIKSRYFEAELEDMLLASGFGRVEFLSARALIDRYLDGKNAAFDMPDEATSILTARV
ncbi:MAG: SAM-dependent methyltransferase [Acidimicrobiales bacterium]|nr:class I SAM-dependent methyltransferase [Hyphomonadaceae bacterium]RZV40910.1 MAG: SAM-dependent methyltransferase [Acidimicrobiales bacterium]